MKYYYFFLIPLLFICNGSVAQRGPFDQVKREACWYVDNLLDGVSVQQPPNNYYIEKLTEDIVDDCSYACKAGVEWCNDVLKPSEPNPTGIPDLDAELRAAYQRDKQRYHDSCFIPDLEDCNDMAERAKRCTRDVLEDHYDFYNYCADD